MRHAVVAALRELAVCPDVAERADAGRSLAVFADVPESHNPLVRLVLDEQDSFVIRATAVALLRRGDAIGYRILGRAVSAASDDQTGWIGDAVLEVFTGWPLRLDIAIQQCREQLRDLTAEDGVGLGTLLGMLEQLRAATRRTPHP